MFLTVFDKFLVSFGLREVYMAPRGTPDLVEGLKKPQKWTALVAYVILDTKFFIQLQKLRKLRINTKTFIFVHKIQFLGNDVSQPFKVLGRIPASKVGFAQFRIFPTSHQLSSNQIYIYTWPIQFFLDVLKSYESESSISAV